MRRWIPLWIIPAVIVFAIGTVWLRLTIVRTTYKITDADRAIRKLQKDREQAELRYASLRSPRRLELLARSKFGLTQPRSDQIVHLTVPAEPGPSPTLQSGKRNTPARAQKAIAEKARTGGAGE